MTALLIVDLQNDFMPGGALPVAQAGAVIPIVNSLLDRSFDLVVAIRDWHPSNHGSFAANHPGKKPGDIILLGGIEQCLWPVHCVQDTLGSSFVPGWDVPRVRHFIFKGTDPDIDSYSAFYDNAHRKNTGLSSLLRKHRVHTVYIAGVATDYCVKYSALDALREGYRTVVIEDACAGVELAPGDCAHAFEVMKEAGATLIKAAAIPV